MKAFEEMELLLTKQMPTHQRQLLLVDDNMHLRWLLSSQGYVHHCLLHFPPSYAASSAALPLMLLSSCQYCNDSSTQMTANIIVARLFPQAYGADPRAFVLLQSSVRIYIYIYITEHIYIYI